jgi:hypothetical protein
MTRACAFCRSRDDLRKIAGAVICRRCWQIFLTLGEVVAIAPSAISECEGCGHEAEWVDSGHCLCESCHGFVADQASKRVLSLQLAGDLERVRRLPEIAETAEPAPRCEGCGADATGEIAQHALCDVCRPAIGGVLSTAITKRWTSRLQGEIDNLPVLPTDPLPDTPPRPVRGAPRRPQGQA